MARTLLRIAGAVVGIGAFLLAEALDFDAVRALFPDDAEWQAFMADPDSFPLLWVQVTE